MIRIIHKYLLLTVFILASCTSGTDNDNSGDDATADDTQADDADDSTDDAGDDDSAPVDETCLFHVNGEDDLYHESPLVAMNNGGKFAVVWLRYPYGVVDDDRTSDDNKAVDDEAIMARFYAEDGTASSEPVLVATHFHNAAIAAGDDKVLVAWSSYSPAGVYARLYAWDGTPDGESFKVAPDTSENAYLDGVTMRADGEIMIWYAYGDVGDYGYYAKRYDDSGVAEGEEIPLGSGEYSYVGFIGLADDGRFARVWTDYSDEPNYKVAAQVYQADGTPNGDAFLVHPDEEVPHLAMGLSMAPDGHFVVNWGEPDLLLTRLYNPDGTPLTDEIQVNGPSRGGTAPSAVAMAPDGRYIVMWSFRSSDRYLTAMKFRRFDAGGNALGPETYAFGYDRSYSYGYPWSIGISAAGSFILAIDRFDDDDVYINIVARRFNADGNPLCQEE